MGPLQLDSQYKYYPGYVEKLQKTKRLQVQGESMQHAVTTNRLVACLLSIYLSSRFC